jgi:uncharacterized coiled-coil DUF342 family protein
MSQTDTDAPIHQDAPEISKAAAAASSRGSPREAELLQMVDELRRERDRAIEVIAQQHALIEDQRRAYDELRRDLDDLRKGLAENRELARRYRMLDLAANAERDPAAPSQ